MCWFVLIKCGLCLKKKLKPESNNIIIYTLANIWSKCSIKMEITIIMKQTVATAHVGVFSKVVSETLAILFLNYAN